MEDHWKFLGGGGFLKTKFLEAMYENKLEFLGGEGGCKTKNLPWGEYGYFLELHIYHLGEKSRVGKGYEPHRGSG